MTFHTDIDLSSKFEIKAKNNWPETGIFWVHSNSGGESQIAWIFLYKMSY